MSSAVVHIARVPRRAAWLAPLLLAGALAGCERGADSGATANPVAPGRPGDAERVEVSPTPGSPNQSPQVGGSTAAIPEGITGSGGPTDVPRQGMQSRSVPLQPGARLDGGLNDGQAAGAREAARQAGAGPASGTPNQVNSNAVGQR